MWWCSSLALHKTKVLNSYLVVGCPLSLQINERTQALALWLWLFARSAGPWQTYRLKTQHYPDTTASALRVQWWIYAKETGQALCEPWALLCPWHWGLLAPAKSMPCCCMPFWSLPKSTSPRFAVPTQNWTHWKAQHTHFPFSFPVLSQTRRCWYSKQGGLYQKPSKP